MNSKYVGTKKLEEEEGKTAGATRSKPVSKETLIKGSRDKFYSNLKEVYVANKDAAELPVAEKKKPANDIVKRNMARAAAAKPAAKTMPPVKPKTAEPKKGKLNTDSVNIEVKLGTTNFTMDKNNMGIFNTNPKDLASSIAGATV